MKDDKTERKHLLGALIVIVFFSLWGTCMQPIPVFINEDVTGKPDGGVAQVLGRSMDWTQKYISDPFEYARVVYVEGHTVAPSRLNLEAWAASDATTPRQKQFFIESNAIWVDFDAGLPQLSWPQLLEWLNTSPTVRDYASLIVPSSSFGKNGIPKFHMLFWLDTFVRDIEEFKRLWWRVEGQLHRELGVKSDPAFRSPVQAVFGTRLKYVSPVGIVPYARNVELPIEVLKGWAYADYADLRDIQPVSEAFKDTKIGEKRVERHFAQPSSEQERIVLSALGSVLHKWGHKTHEEWLRMWMSAHHASNGSLVVRDYIIAHEDVFWEDDQEAFKNAWAMHKPIEGGYSAASLFWLARQSGWLTSTGYEINPKLAENINVRYIGDWLATLDTVPERLLLMSQTGSGKTYSLKYLYDKLGSPKTVVFVPSIKLALELTSTLVNRHGLPAVCYYDQELGGSIAVTDMLQAPILVTTLQTFAMKVNLPMETYGLVYIEESDQLIAGFARGGGGQFSSHVSDQEARAGFRVLRNAFLKSEVVWCVDATMSQVTYKTANDMSNIPVRTIINTWVEPKADVVMLDDIGIALQKVLGGLGLGKKVVAVCDTANAAEEVHNVMKNLGALEGKRSIVINRANSVSPDVHTFMEDVNGEAGKYDLVCYNSVMASGVSITDFTPDIIVQFASFLTPRVNLQLLNRYRKQKEVYCYYKLSEQLYSQSDKAILERAHEQVKLEGRLINMPLASRNDDASLRDAIGAISAADQLGQEKSPRDFYISLLKQDGRNVLEQDATPVSDIINKTRKAVSEGIKAYKEELKSTWILTPPISHDEPAPEGYTDMQIAQGEIHEAIRKALRGNIPSGCDPKLVYDVVNEFKDYSMALSALLNSEWAVGKAQSYLADDGKALMTVYNNLSTITLVNIVRVMYPTLDSYADISKDEEFLAELGKQSQLYDLVVSRKPQKFEVVESKTPETTDRALAFAKIILAQVGLKQKSVRMSQTGGKAEYGYKVDNFDNAKLFLSWRSPELVAGLAAPTIAPLTKAKLENRGLTDYEVDAIMGIMRTEKTDLKMATEIVRQGVEL